MLKDRIQQTLAFKSLDVEELIDRYFHRPIAALVAALLLPLPVTPNQVTLTSLLTGWMGSFFLYRAFFVDGTGPTSMWLLAGFFLFAAVILDCVDGQLARAKGGGSRVGRILDGFVDVLVLVPAYVLLGFGIREHFDTLWFVIASIAGFSTWIHCIVYDKLKNLYLASTKPEADGADGTETVASVRADLDDARSHGSPLERFLLRIYLVYLQIQERFASGSTEKRTHRLDDAAIQAFRGQHRSTMHLASYLGLGTHMFIIYAGIALMAVDLRVALAMQILFATLFNLIMFISLWRARGFSTSP